MQIKHFDKVSGKWVTDGASNAANLELTNPGFVDEAGNSISINEGFTKLDNRLSKAEQNLAWIYLNGAKGDGSGGGGGGGGTGEDYTLKVFEGETIYTSTNTATINIMISSAGIRKSFTVIAKDLATNKVIGTWKKFSMSRTDLTFTDLSGTTDIELTAYDASNKYTTPVYIKIVAGAVRLEIQKIPNKTIYIGGVGAVPLNFTLINNVLGSPASFEMTINNIKVSEITGITIPSHSISLDARKLLFDSEHFNPQSGQRFIFRAVAKTILGMEIIKSNEISFDITVADSNKLTIVTDEITEFIPNDEPGTSIENLTPYAKGQQLAFSYYFSYGLTKYQTFNMDYSVVLVDGPTETVIEQNTILNINKSEVNRFVYSTVNMAVTSPTQYIRLDLFGYAINDPSDIDAQFSKSVTCIIVESERRDLYANNDLHTLLAYFSKVSGFPNTATGTWNYPIKTSGDFIYEGTFGSKFPNGVNLSLYKVNGKTSGFLVDSDGVNSIPAIRLEGESYGRLEVAEQMFPDADISSGLSFFQPAGFNISTTFKADPSSDASETILSIGRYENGLLYSGFEINLEMVTVKVGSADTLTCKIPQNELLTIDLDVSYSGGGWYFKVFINGVMSAVTRVLEADIDWTFAQDIFLGCRNDNGILSRYSNAYFYDLKVYTSSQSEYAVVQNYMSATEQALLIKGEIDQSLDTELRLKNLFDSAGNCLIWDKTLNSGKGGFLEGERLYNRMVEQIQENTPYPIVLIEETSNSPTLFEPYTTAIFSAADKEEIMKKTFPCKITYQDTKGKCVITTPSGISSDEGVRVGIQGTSSLSYNSKNLEIQMGLANPDGTQQLFLPTDEWLPENRFTLKADVMDSAHVNNVVIGKIVNGAIKNDQGQSVSPFGATPPMALGNEIWDGNVEQANKIKSRIRHTSDGFPCLLFVRYAPDKDGNTKQPKFFGIYNFNLGRYAHYNLGMKLLKDYVKESENGPSVVKEFTEINNLWNTGVEGGMYSLEINQNSSAQGAFQQDDMSIVKFMADVAYTSRDTQMAYNKAQQFYKQMANMALTKIQKYTMDDAGQTPTKPIVGEFYDLDKGAYYNFDACDKYLNWNNGCAYFIVALLFGMVDSMCKNLTIRNWGTNEWYPSFYDMDTAFGLNNAGQDVVEYFAHLHRWYNIPSLGTGVTTFTVEKNYVSSDEIKQYFASWWNRIWEVLENLSGIDSGNTVDRTSLETTYANMRINLFPNPDDFINKYYKSYTEQTGSIMFNYDYNIKYLKIAQKYNPNTGQYEDTTDFSQLKFLHGNRVMHVRDWFRKRVYFLDSVYAYKPDAETSILLPANIESPINSVWLENKVTGSSEYSKVAVTVAGNSRVLHHFNFDKSRFAYWIAEKEEEAVVPIPFGETIFNFYANKYITKYDNFRLLPWTSLASIDLPLLNKLDLTGLTNIDAAFFFSGGVYRKATDVGLKNIKELILSRVRLVGSTASAYTLDVSNCDKLQKLDISESTITKVTLPKSAVLKEYNLSGTEITSLNLSNQAFLETVLIGGCNKLTTIELNNCASLKNINIPTNVERITIRNCQSLEQLDIPYTGSSSMISPLVELVIDNCPGLKVVNLAYQNNQALDVSLIGAWNLESLDVSGTTTDKIVLPALFVEGRNFTSLRSLNIARTNISSLKYNDKHETEFLDLSTFPDLSSIFAHDCSRLTRVVCANNENNPIELQSNAFANCTSLKRVEGNFLLQGSDIFRDCLELILNTEDTYSRFGINDYYTGPNVTNMNFDPMLDSCIGLFEGCAAISFDDFNYLMVRLTDKMASLERMFKGCVSITGEIWYDIFRHAPNLTTIKEFVSGSGLTGTFYSRKAEYSKDDQSTWGILDFVPKLIDTEGAFSNTALLHIDNNIFAPLIEGDKITYSSIINANKMFSGCSALKSVADTRADVIEDGFLNSEDFFLNLRNLMNTYPDEMFIGCQEVYMNVANRGENTLLFHTLRPNAKPMVLTNSLYAGVNLVGEVKENVFGGISRTVDEFTIPQFTSIHGPFQNTGGKLNIDLSLSGRLFKGIAKDLLQAVRVFDGLKLIGTKSIPDNLFEGCIKLNSIEGIFSNLDLDNNGQIYEFPNSVIFKDCLNLQNISYMLQECNKMKIKLLGKGFENCKIKNAEGAFRNSSIFGTIPYQLFYMHKNGVIQRTIENMSNVFEGCYYLGYDETRELDLTSKVGDVNNIRTVTWTDHIVQVKGKEVYYKLDVSKMEKVINPKNTSEMIFDEWYLDGFGWEGATALNPAEQSELNAVKSKLQPLYFDYDDRQKEVIRTQLELERYIPTYQNYMVPTDLFRYCSEKCTLAGVLNNLCWDEHVLIENMETGGLSINKTGVIDGMKGRIPARLLDDLTTSITFDKLFYKTRFTPYVGLNSATFERGLLCPPNLFANNVELVNLTNTFEETIIPVGVDVNEDIFVNNVNLRIASGIFGNCQFDNRKYNTDSLPEIDKKHAQIKFRELFKTNVRLTNVSNLFGVTKFTTDILGLRIIEDTLLDRCFNLNSIGSMFMGNSNMVGAVPEFKAVVYPVINVVSGYLSGVPKSNITNADQLEARLIPEEWLN